MVKVITAQKLRQYWKTSSEVALIDIREEGPYAESHPLFAISIPVSEIEEKLPRLIPRLSVPIVIYDNGEGYTERAAVRIQALGYEDISILDGGLSAYARVGEVYRDVNVPSKAFGELVESIKHTPSLPAQDVKDILDTTQDVVVLDARRFEEFNTMSIPRGRSLPGGELVYRIYDVVPSKDTLVIVNCAGRTRSIIGAQSLIDAGVPNRVLALRNGAIGWTLEGLELDKNRTERVSEPSTEGCQWAREKAGRWAKHVGIATIGGDELSQFRAESATRTLYTLDVRDPDEYKRGHPEGFISAPGGQLVQATDEWVGVRGARIVLYDQDGVRALMTASWLLQMGWDVCVLGNKVELASSTIALLPLLDIRFPEYPIIQASELKALLKATVVDLARSTAYRKGHIPGAYFASGPELSRDIAGLNLESGPLVLTSPDGRLAAANIQYIQAKEGQNIRLLSGGTASWVANGYPLDTEAHWLSEPIDVYKRPYEGVDNAREKMEGYIEWELQLIAQLANDGISGFHVVR